MGRLFVSLLSVACCVAICRAQKLDISDLRVGFDDFVQEITDDFSNFRKQANAEFAEFMKNPWKEFEESAPIPAPQPKPVPPVIKNDEDDKPLEDRPIVIEEVVEPPIEEPQPQPIEPIEEVPVLEPEYLDFTFFGTTEHVMVNKDHLPHLDGIDEISVSMMFVKLSSGEFDNLIFSCIGIRNRRELSDWAYLQMLNKVAATAYPDNVSEAQVLMAFLYIMSGYKMRMASDGSRLYMLYSSKHDIYSRTYYFVDNDKYYGIDDLPNTLRVCQTAYPGEKSLSLYVTKSQHFDYDMAKTRSICSERYPDMRMDVAVNKNLIDFYSTYPASTVEQNFMTQWAMKANAQIDSDIASSLYPKLKNQLKDKTELEAANMLLNMLQTGLVYEFDDKVWGADRAFFTEETLYYPYCDCEDRAILLSRLVRDLLGLNCLLVYYPGHLAAAIEFTGDTVKGDYIMLENRKFVIADPTYINAEVGLTMPEMDNSTAKVIMLN